MSADGRPASVSISQSTRSSGSAVSRPLRSMSAQNPSRSTRALHHTKVIARCPPYRTTGNSEVALVVEPVAGLLEVGVGPRGQEEERLLGVLVAVVFDQVVVLALQRVQPADEAAQDALGLVRVAVEGLGRLLVGRRGGCGGLGVVLRPVPDERHLLLHPYIIGFLAIFQ